MFAPVGRKKLKLQRYKKNSFLPDISSSLLNKVSFFCP